jgi:hypothetical protein
MANNRTEFVTQVVNKIVAIVTISKHRDVLNNDLAESINFRKDVKGTTQTVGSGSGTASVNADFTTSDLVTIDAATNNRDIEITILNTVDGEDSKYIKVLKDANKNVGFASGTDISTFDVRGETEAVYEVINKDGSIYVKALKGGTVQKEIEIGDWNMDTLLFVPITHNLSNFKNVRVTNAMIRNDADDSYYDIGAAGNVGRTDSTTIVLNRDTGGLFDSTDFDSTSYNRGWITIEYKL